MIPLFKSSKTKSIYQQWFEDNRQDLEEKFEDYWQSKTTEWIKQAHREIIQGHLFPTSYEKCVYCERKADVLQIDHFYPKKVANYKHLAFDFENLLPCCQACNTSKGQQVTWQGAEMLNPYKTRNLSRHLCLNVKNLRISGLSSKGQATVFNLKKALNLKVNSLGKKKNSARSIRCEIAKAINNRLKGLKKHLHNTDFVILTLQSLLDKLDRQRSFTATRATLLLNHPDFISVMEHLQNLAPERHQKLAALAAKRKHLCLQVE